MAEGLSFLKTAFLAVASCAAVHVGFAFFGVEHIFDEIGAWAAGGEPLLSDVTTGLAVAPPHVH